MTTTHHGPIVVGEPSNGRAIAFKYTATDGPEQGPRSAAAPTAIRVCRRNGRSDAGLGRPLQQLRIWGRRRRHRLPYARQGARSGVWRTPGSQCRGGRESTSGRAFIPFEEMPRIRNPENGFIVTANNKQVDDDYPYYISVQYATEHRARRIYDRLKEMPNATVEDMGERSCRTGVDSRTGVPEASSQGVEPADELSAEAKSILLEWDGKMDADAVGPASVQRVPLLPRRHGHPPPPGTAGRLCAERGGSRRASSRVAAQGPDWSSWRRPPTIHGCRVVQRGRHSWPRRWLEAPSEYLKDLDRQRYERVDVGHDSTRRTGPTGCPTPTPGLRNWKARRCRSAGTATRL